MKRDVSRKITYANSARTRAGRAVIRGMEALTVRPSMRRRARGHDDAVVEGVDFWEAMARRHGLTPQVVRGHPDLIPTRGPVVIVANHPYGILDGLILSLLLARRRPLGFKVMANELFLGAPDLADDILPVSFDETRDAQARNLSMRKHAISYLQAGGALGVFPGGAVSTPATPFGPTRDPRWRGFTGKLIRASGATVVPVHFDGTNSHLFQLASHLHATLRTGLLIREFRARTDRPVRLSIGAPILPADIAEIPGNKRELMDALRVRTYALGEQTPELGFDWDNQKAGCT